MKYVGLGETGITTAVPDMSESEFQVWFGRRRLESCGRGIGLYLWPYEIKDLRVEHVHDRWPRISYTFGKSTFTDRSITIPALFTVCWLRFQFSRAWQEEISSRLLLLVRDSPKVQN
jgi:hypothetical protein